MTTRSTPASPPSLTSSRRSSPTTTPTSPRTPTAGSPTPPLNGQRCYGLNLADALTREGSGLVLKYLLDFYQQSTDKAHFFGKYFEELSGTTSLREQIIADNNKRYT